MTPTVQFLEGDCRDTLKTLADESVHCCITSPPYWGLRDYGVDGQLGLEETPEEYLAKMVAVFREVKRVLRRDGTAWVNMGDCYNSGTSAKRKASANVNHGYWENGGGMGDERVDVPGLQPKQLVGMPWRLAFALQADGWWLRSDIIWHKPNPMPESVTDRPTKAHEYVFLFAKGRSHSRTIEFSDVLPERVHFGLDLGKHRSDVRSTALCVAIATAFFNAAQTQEKFSLPPFYSEEWEKCFNYNTSELVPNLPPIHTMAAYSSRFLNSKTTSKEFLGEIQRAWTNLGEANHLLIGRALSESSDSPSVLINGDAAIAINYAGKISKINFLHGQIIDTVPTDCKYFYDAEAIKEPAIRVGDIPGGGALWRESIDRRIAVNRNGAKPVATTRNRRDVWTIPSAPYSEAHFATFPPDLVKPCILAGTSARGCCPKCGAPWERVVEKSGGTTGKSWHDHKDDLAVGMRADDQCARNGWLDGTYKVETLGWRPGCECGDMVNDGEMVGKSSFKPIPCTVLDPFGGSGTTGMVALELGRNAILCELNPDYLRLARQRCCVTPGLCL